MLRTLLTTTALFPLLVSCATLPAIDELRCGNGVVESGNGEECDTFAPEGARCGAAGTPSACRYECSESSCPSGFGCGNDGICRTASASFSVVGEGTSSLQEPRLADMDGDGLADLIASSPRGIEIYYTNTGFTVSEPSVLAVDRGRFTTAGLQSARGQRAAPSTLVILDTNLGGESAGASGGGLNVYRGSRERQLLPTLYPAFPIAASDVRVASAAMTRRVGQSGAGTDLFAFTEISALPGEGARGLRGGGYSLGHFDIRDDGITNNKPLASLDELQSFADGNDLVAVAAMGDPIASGRLIGAFQLPTPQGVITVNYPCDTLGWSNTDPAVNAAWVQPTCVLDLAAGTANPNYLGGNDPPAIDATRPLAPRTKLIPPEGHRITGGVYFRDVAKPVQVDGRWTLEPADGLLDVLVPSNHGLLVAYAVAANPAGPWSLFAGPEASPSLALEPYHGIGATEATPSVLPPLAIGDFDGNGWLDWVSARGIHFNATANPLLAAADRTFDDAASVARVADFNGDGREDVAIGATDGLVVYLSQKTPGVLTVFNRQRYPARGPVTRITVGDFDGDASTDLGFTAHDVGSGDDALNVIFGSQGFPTGQQELGVLPAIGQLLTARLSWLLSGELDTVDSLVGVGMVGQQRDVPVCLALQGRPNRQINSRFGLVGASAPLRRGIAQVVSGGHFTRDDNQSLMILAGSVEVSRDTRSSYDTTFRLWNVPSSGEATLDSPRTLSSEPFAVTPGLESGPDAAAALRVAAQVVVSSVLAVDLDGDGVDEAVVTLPRTLNEAGEEERPAKLLVGHVSESGVVFTERGLPAHLPSAVSGRTAPSFQLFAGDVDGDGHRDVVLSYDVDAAASTTPNVGYTILFGDGTRNLDETRATVVPADGRMRALTVVSTAGSQARLVAVTSDAQGSAIETWQLAGRSLPAEGPRRSSFALVSPTAVAASDLDGDGVADLVVTGSSGFVFLRGTAVVQ